MVYFDSLNFLEILRDLPLLRLSEQKKEFTREELLFVQAFFQSQIGAETLRELSCRSFVSCRQQKIRGVKGIEKIESLSFFDSDAEQEGDFYPENDEEDF